jgi:hypothetical protein
MDIGTTRICSSDPAGRNRRFIRLILLFQALICGFGLLVAAGVIPKWGCWYSSSPNYAEQVDAFLRGELALSHSPWHGAFDLAWSEGGVHHVSGLGFPLWCLPWTVLVRIFGMPSFPEHLAIGLAFSAIAFVLLVTIIEPALGPKIKLSEVLPAVGTAVILLTFPAFLTKDKAV